MDEHVLAARPAAMANAVANASAAAAATNPEPPPSPTLQPSARRRPDLASSAAPAMPSSRPGAAMRDELEELDEETSSNPTLRKGSAELRSSKGLTPGSLFSPVEKKAQVPPPPHLPTTSPPPPRPPLHLPLHPRV